MVSTTAILGAPIPELRFPIAVTMRRMLNHQADAETFGSVRQQYSEESWHCH
jgi:hypothetical protein